MTNRLFFLFQLPPAPPLSMKPDLLCSSHQNIYSVLQNNVFLILELKVRLIKFLDWGLGLSVVSLGLYFCLEETGYVVQTGLELLGSTDAPASASGLQVCTTLPCEALGSTPINPPLPEKKILQLDCCNVILCDIVAQTCYSVLCLGCSG
jgi:hypothetical protein